MTTEQPPRPPAPKRIALAPLLGYSDRFFRYYARCLSREVWVYTEMVVAEALLRNKPERYLLHDPQEAPIALQLAGSRPEAMAQAARIGQDAGFDEINLNIGCPSKKALAGHFGACLMQQPALVAECVQSIRQTCTLPVSIKCRIGLDAEQSEEPLHEFVRLNQQAGCQIFILHARNAQLKGLTPKLNRSAPPLRPSIVYRLKQAFPMLSVQFNGGIGDWAQAREHLRHCDGVMIGRWAMQDAYRCLIEVDAICAALQSAPAPTTPPPSRAQLLQQMAQFIEQERSKLKAREQRTRRGGLLTMLRPLMTLLHGQNGATEWRRTLSHPPAPATEGALQHWLLTEFERVTQMPQAEPGS